MPTRVIDEFSNLPVSRQRKTQLRYHRDGKCIICGQPSVTKTHCLKHAYAHRERERERNGRQRQNYSALDRLGQKEIQDEFTPLPLPYSKKMKLRWRRDGMCLRCGDSAITATLCLKHAEMNRKRRSIVLGAQRGNLNVPGYYRSMPEMASR